MTTDPAPGWGLVLGSGIGCGVGAITAVEAVGPQSPRWTFVTYVLGGTAGGLLGLGAGGAAETALTV